jgi:hypothetical protein
VLVPRGHGVAIDADVGLGEIRPRLQNGDSDDCTRSSSSGRRRRHGDAGPEVRVGQVEVRYV